jgi:ABC-2 type transport system ATP-binding protein
VTAITAGHLTKRYGELAAVDDVSFEVPRGQFLAVLGPNGAGKTTMLEMLEGFTAPTAGTVRVLGADPRHGGRRWRARTGLILQSTSLDAELTVAATLALYGRLYPAPRPVAEVLELVGLTADAQVRVGALSGGQRRRVDVAIAVTGRPDVLFLDEPTTGLDPEARRRTWAAITDLTAAGTTVLLTTHYIEEADNLADRVLVLAGGRIVADATPRELRARGGASSIRFPLPCASPTNADPTGAHPSGPALAASLPAALAGHVRPDGRALVISGADVTTALRELLAWADARHLDLTGIEVGPPSLEDAYLAATGGSLALEASSHD